MSFFSGVAAGFGEGQGQYNSKMLDFMNEKSKTMAQLYGHLADTAQDPDMQTEFANRAMGWAQANPLLDPKGYKNLVSQEKGGLHGVVDQSHQQKVTNYHQQNFGTPAPAMPGSGGAGGGQGNTQAPAAASSSPVAPMAQSPFGMPKVPESPEASSSPAMAAPQPQPAPQMASSGPGMTQPPSSAMPPPMGIQGPQNNSNPQTMIEFAKHMAGPEPPAYSGVGRETLEHQMWREEVHKRAEQMVPTPAGMQQFVGAPFMPAGFASPISMMMGREMQANARMVGSGYKMVNGQAVPLNPDEYSLAAQVKMNKDNMSAQLSQASIPLRQAMGQYYNTKTAYIPQEMKLKLSALGIALDRFKLQEESTNAHLFSVGPDGKPLVGSLVLDGVPVSPFLSHNVLPTGATQSKAETAIPVMQQTDVLSQFAKANPDIFGRVQGNFMNWLASGHNMTNDPREGDLRAATISLASLMVPLHGFRSQKAAEEFMGRLSQGLSPEGFVSALKAFNAVGSNLYDNGMPSIIGGQGQIRPRMAKPTNAPPPQSKFNIGQTFSKGGKTYKVTKVNSDGGVDAVEVP